MFCRDRAGVRYQLLIDVLDMWIPAAGLGIVNFNDGVVGMFGYVFPLQCDTRPNIFFRVITSLMAFRSQWNSIQMG